MRSMTKTEGGSYVIGELPDGCKYCIRGSKVVIFVTGKCPSNCYYCPLSDERKNSSDSFVDEKKIKREKDVITEAELINAEGAGLTGGDPLVEFDKTVNYIRLLKKIFGEKFHIHLYTTGILLTEEKLEKLIKSGLDEIRVHPYEGGLSFIRLFKNKKISFGCEVPVIPGEEEKLEQLIWSLEENGVDFINLNELEFSETNASELKKRGFKLKEETIAAVDGSEETAFKVLRWAEKNTNRINIHYCPASLKDSVQLRNRFIRRARNVRKTYEEANEDGLLLRGVFILPSPEKHVEIRQLLIDKYEVPIEMIEVDVNNRRVYTAWYIAEELSSEMKELNVETRIEKCYPTDDRLVIESYIV